jgi:dihydrofolate reductase
LSCHLAALCCTAWCKTLNRCTTNGNQRPEKAAALSQDAAQGTDVDICLIWAHAPNRTDPDSVSWLAAEDLRRYQTLTERHPVLMGCRTWDTIPQALLAGRQSFVLTKRKTIPGAVACTSLHEAFTLASVLRSGKLFLLGGSTVHEQGLRVADRVYVARFDQDADAADAACPSIDLRLFELVRQDRTGSIGPRRLFQEYQRRRLH